LTTNTPIIITPTTCPIKIRPYKKFSPPTRAIAPTIIFRKKRGNSRALEHHYTLFEPYNNN